MTDINVLKREIVSLSEEEFRELLAFMHERETKENLMFSLRAQVEQTGKRILGLGKVIHGEDYQIWMSPDFDKYDPTLWEDEEDARLSS